jgi:hypothetical protein
MKDLKPTMSIRRMRMAPDITTPWAFQAKPLIREGFLGCGALPRDAAERFPH